MDKVTFLFSFFLDYMQVWCSNWGRAVGRGSKTHKRHSTARNRAELGRVAQWWV